MLNFKCYVRSAKEFQSYKTKAKTQEKAAGEYPFWERKDFIKILKLS